MSELVASLMTEQKVEICRNTWQNTCQNTIRSEVGPYATTHFHESTCQLGTRAEFRKKNMPEDMSDGMPDFTAGQLPEHLSTRTSNHIPEDFPGIA